LRVSPQTAYIRSGLWGRRRRTRSFAQAWTAQQRLHRRDQRFTARGKPKQQIVTAIACAFTGFVWAALTS